MVMESGVECPSKLQASILATNICWKRSTKYTSFSPMYGREENCTYLLEHNNFLFDDDEGFLEPEISNTEVEATDILSPEYDHQDDWMMPLEDSRLTTRMQAQDNIRNMQILQKHVFDKKVKNSR